MLMSLENAIGSWYQCWGSGMFIPCPECLSVSRIRNFQSPIPGQNGTESRIKINEKEFKYLLTRKLLLSSLEIWSGTFIPDPGSGFLIIPDPGLQKAPDPGSESATLDDAGTNLRILTASWCVAPSKLCPFTSIIRSPTCN